MFIRNVGNSVFISMLRHLVKTVGPDATLVCGTRQCDQILAFIISQEFWDVGRIKGAKCPFDLQFLTWDFS